METLKSEIVTAEIIASDAQSELKISELNPTDVIKLKQVVDDYEKMRKVVLFNVEQSTKMSAQMAEDMELSGFDAELVSAFAKLVETTNKSLKILTDSYKTISDILLNINKINSTSTITESKEDIDAEIVSTADILKRLKKPDS